MPYSKLSVVVPTLDEGATIEACLAPLQDCRSQGLEIVVVDGGSRDDTLERADRLADLVLSAPAPGRALQQNVGWRAARGQRIAFLHADTQVVRQHLEALVAQDGPCWGRFDVRLSGRHFAFRIIERAISWRSRLTRMATGDQVMFADRELLEAVGGFPELPLMEDLALSKRLRKDHSYRCLKPPVVTSSRRWERHGIVRTIWLMWSLRYAWWRGVPADALALRYRKAR